MRILFDITHPAHAWFFRAAIDALIRSGHRVLVTSRAKDVTLPLLDSFGIEHQCLSAANPAKLRRIGEMLTRDWRLYSVMRKFKPDVILAKHGLFACHAGWLARVPVITFDDTDDAPIQQKLSFPLAWRVYTDRSYRTPIGPKQRIYNAVSPLAYLHPHVFQPDPTVRRRAGIGADQKIIVCRLVSWTANHDLRQRGFDPSALIRAVAALSQHGRVCISSEVSLPPELEPLRIRLPVADLHHLLAEASLYLGESATMATEAAVLGVPSIHVSTRTLWYTRLLESRGLLHNTDDTAAALDLATRLLADASYRNNLLAKRAAYLQEADDLTSVIVGALDELPQAQTAPHSSTLATSPAGLQRQTRKAS